MATHSSMLAWRIPMDRGAWQLQSTVSQRRTRLNMHMQKEIEPEALLCELSNLMEGNQPQAPFLLLSQTLGFWGTVAPRSPCQGKDRGHSPSGPTPLRRTVYHCIIKLSAFGRDH